MVLSRDHCFWSGCFYGTCFVFLLFFSLPCFVSQGFAGGLHAHPVLPRLPRAQSHPDCEDDRRGHGRQRSLHGKGRSVRIHDQLCLFPQTILLWSLPWRTIGLRQVSLDFLPVPYEIIHTFDDGQWRSIKIIERSTWILELGQNDNAWRFRKPFRIDR